MGLFLKEHAPGFDHIVTSPAVRARTTAEVIAESLGLDEAALMQQDDLYLASSESLVQAIRRFPDEWEHTGVVGHNPGITYLAEYLTDRPFGNIPTCGVLHLSCPIDHWAKLRRDACEVLFYQIPRKLPPETET